MMAQSFVAAGRTRTRDLPPNALSAHFINGGDIEKDMEFQVVRLRDERRFANRRVEVTQDGILLATVMISYLAGGRGLEHNVEPPDVADPEACRRSRSSCGATRRRFHTSSTHCSRSNGVTPTTRPG